MKYLVIDAQLHGTGIRDFYEGGYIDACTLGLSDDVVKKINDWLFEYEEEHYNSFEDLNNIEKLDKEGMDIAFIIKKQLSEAKIEYYSAAKMVKMQVPPG